MSYTLKNQTRNLMFGRTSHPTKQYSGKKYIRIQLAWQPWFIIKKVCSGILLEIICCSLWQWKGWHYFAIELWHWFHRAWSLLTDHSHWESVLEQKLFGMLSTEGKISRILGTGRLSRNMRSIITVTANWVKAHEQCP